MAAAPLRGRRVQCEHGEQRRGREQQRRRAACGATKARSPVPRLQGTRRQGGSRARTRGPPGVAGTGCERSKRDQRQEPEQHPERKAEVAVRVHAPPPRRRTTANPTAPPRPTGGVPGCRTAAPSRRPRSPPPPAGLSQHSERREEDAVGERVVPLVPAPVPDREPGTLEKLRPKHMCGEVVDLRVPGDDSDERRAQGHRPEPPH